MCAIIPQYEIMNLSQISILFFMQTTWGCSSEPMDSMSTACGVMQGSDRVWVQSGPRVHGHLAARGHGTPLSSKEGAHPAEPAQTNHKYISLNETINQTKDASSSYPREKSLLQQHGWPLHSQHLDMETAAGWA